MMLLWLLLKLLLKLLLLLLLLLLLVRFVCGCLRLSAFIRFASVCLRDAVCGAQECLS